MCPSARSVYYIKPCVAKHSLRRSRRAWVASLTRTHTRTNMNTHNPLTTFQPYQIRNQNVQSNTCITRVRMPAVCVCVCVCVWERGTRLSSDRQAEEGSLCPAARVNCSRHHACSRLSSRHNIPALQFRFADLERGRRKTSRPCLRLGPTSHCRWNTDHLP